MTVTKKRGAYKKHLVEKARPAGFAPEINSDILPITEATDISPEDFHRLMEDKDAALKNYTVIVEGLQKSNTDIITHYNADMTYMSELNANVVKNFRAKEDATMKVIEGVLELMKIDRNVLAPARKED